METAILEFENIGKSFFGVRALHDVTCTLRRGRILGLIGENGAGKSTLMNILGGVTQADSGRMVLNGRPYSPRSAAEATRAGVAFIHQELNLFPNLSIEDNMFIDRFPRLGRLPLVNRTAIRRRTRELLARVDLDLSPRTLVETLTPGERQLVEIAKALSYGAEIIIFDEPTTSLTTRETRNLFRLIDQLRAGGKSMIFISHTLGDVLEIADDIVVLRDGRIVGTGPRAEFSINTMIALMVGREIDQLYPPRRFAPTAEVALAVEGVSQSGIVRDIRFTLHRGEVLGIFGLMGSGRSELARILFGLDAFETGRITLLGRAARRVAPAGNIRRGMAFVTENRREEGLMMEAPMLDNLALVSLPRYARRSCPRFVDQARLLEAAGALAASLRIKSGPIQRHTTKDLSGGNQQKVVIGKWLMADPAVFLMDEPTRGIDIGAKYDVYALINDLAARGTAILFISSELEELVGICDRILVMRNGEIRGEFEREAFDEATILRAAFGEADFGNPAVAGRTGRTRT